jgi:hypothetical protein
VKKTTKQQKINWLLANYQLWEGYGFTDSMGTSKTQRYTRTVFAMQEAGLWSKRNHGEMHNLGLLIEEARKQRRMQRR